jgi:uncharacterized membrane protein
MMPGLTPGIFAFGLTVKFLRLWAKHCTLLRRLPKICRNLPPILGVLESREGASSGGGATTQSGFWHGDPPVRLSYFAFAVLLPTLAPSLSLAAPANDTNDIKGLYLITDYPAISARPGTTSTIPLKLQNLGLAPERYQLKVSGVPSGWTATLLGGGQPVGAAMPAANDTVPLQLRLDIPANASIGTQTLTVTAEGASRSLSLPVAVTLAKELPAKLRVTAKLPDLRGSAKSAFDYDLTIRNDSGRKLVASFAASAPKNFETSFTEAYGTQELSSIPIEAGQSKDIKLHVRPPSSVDSGRYQVAVKVSADDATADAKLSMEVVGQPRLSIAGRDGLVSASAQAGTQSSVPVIVSNTGSAPAEDINLSGSGPNGWKIAFEPKTLDRLAPGEQKEVQARITPTGKSLAGDYMVALTAASRGETNSADFRVTVSTSTLWGMTGAGIIAAALLIMVGAITRYGRR